MKFSVQVVARAGASRPDARALAAPARLRAVLAATRRHRLLLACVLAFVAHGPVRAETAAGLVSAEGLKDAAIRLPARLAEWRRMIESARLLSDQGKLETVNRFFNRTLLYASDIQSAGAREHWSTPMEFLSRGGGDCEDFAIAKYVTLRMLGLASERLRLMYVHARLGPGKPVAHMVLGYFPQSGADPLVLDNMIDSVRPASVRDDLSPVYSFNTRGLWVGRGTASAADPARRLSRWRGLLQRMRGEGMLSWSPTAVMAEAEPTELASRF